MACRLSGPGARTRRRVAARLLGAAVAYLSLLVLVCCVFVRTRAGQGLDGALLPRAERGGGYEQPTGLVEPAKTVLALFGSPVLLGALLLLVLLVGTLRGRLWAGLAGVTVVLCAVAAASLTKMMILRPDLAVPSSTTHNSFPSGHVAAAMALLLAFMLVLPGGARWWLALPGAAGVALVAAATMIAGWHRFSDAIGGVLLAIVLFFLAAALLPSRDSAGALLRSRGSAGTNTGSRGGQAGLAVGLIVLAGLAFVLVPGAAAATEAGLFIAMALVAGFTVLAVISVLVLIRTVDFGASPASPAGPARPVGPVDPVGPAGPAGPAGPGGPDGRVGAPLGGEDGGIGFRNLVR